MLEDRELNEDIDWVRGRERQGQRQKNIQIQLVTQVTSCLCVSGGHYVCIMFPNSINFAQWT